MPISRKVRLIKRELENAILSNSSFTDVLRLLSEGQTSYVGALLIADFLKKAGRDAYRATRRRLRRNAYVPYGMRKFIAELVEQLRVETSPEEVQSFFTFLLSRLATTEGQEEFAEGLQDLIDEQGEL